VRERLDEDEIDDFEDDDLVGPRSGGTPREADDDARPARPRRAGARARLADDESFSLDDEEDADAAPPRPRRPVRGRSAARGRKSTSVRGRTGGSLMQSDWVRSLVSDVPNFARLLWGLARDSRVSRTDKALVVGVLVYAAVPADVIPDWIPGLGEMEDLLLVALALSRLLTNAGEEVLMDHWEGDAGTLETLLDALDSASEFLPNPVRGLLRGRR